VRIELTISEVKGACSDDCATEAPWGIIFHLIIFILKSMGFPAIWLANSSTNHTHISAISKLLASAWVEITSFFQPIRFNVIRQTIKYDQSHWHRIRKSSKCWRHGPVQGGMPLKRALARPMACDGVALLRQNLRKNQEVGLLCSFYSVTLDWF
jgi:hypothetical protein